MPDEQALPQGPLRSLVAYVHDIYANAGRPPLMTIQRGTANLPDFYTTLSKDRAGKLLHGDEKEAGEWKSVEALIAFLAERAHSTDARMVTASLAEARRLWGAIRAEGALHAQGHDLPTRRHDPLLRPSAHFSRRSFSTHAANDWMRRGKRGPRVLQGALAVSASSFARTSSRLVFDPEFQDEHVRRLQEIGELRRSGHRFATHAEWGPSSYAVYGDITRRDGQPTSFIHVEVHDVGAVAVYFREPVKDGTLAELVGWWVHGALHAALYILQHLGATGFAEGSVLMDRHGLVDPASGVRDTDLNLSLLNPEKALCHIRLPEFALWDHAAGEPRTWLHRTTAVLTSQVEQAARSSLGLSGSSEPWEMANERLALGRNS